MALWDDELEAARPQIRAESADFVGQWAVEASRATDPLERVTAQRAVFDAGAVISDEATDRHVTGRDRPLRLRTIVADQVDGVMLHLHGGGWIIGRPEGSDQLNAFLSKSLNLAVVSVDYRLAPEHPFPAGPDDCEAAALWLLDNAKKEFGTDRMLIGGESAGAHLAVLTLLRLRDGHDAADRFSGANLVFGPYDLGHSPSQRAGDGHDILTAEGIRFFTEQFTPGMTTEQRRRPDISPLYADLRSLPPALFTVGTTDHLADDSLFLASRWEVAGNVTELLVYPDAPHGCIALPTVAKHWFPRLVGFLQRCLAG